MLTAERALPLRQMKPRWDSRDHRQTVYRPVSPAPAETEAAVGLTAKSKSRMVWLMLVCGLACMALIVAAAYTAQVKYELNGILSEAAVVRGEIDNLNVAIEKAENIVAIEEKAKTRLGMVYPEGRQIAYVRAGANDVKGFAQELRKVAFNQ